MLNPLMLLGLLGLSVPVIIHLIHRQRLQPRLLATLRFLDQTDAANAFAPVPRDILQLILRLVLLGLFVLLMARITTESATTGARTLAIILDQSMSMQRKLENGETLFERQKAEIGELIEGMTPEDQFSLLLVGDHVAAETGFTTDKSKLKQALEHFAVSDGGGRALLPAIGHAIQELQTRKEPNTCVVVFSDHQRCNYRTGPSDQPLEAILRRGKVQLFLIEEPLPAEPNVAVESGVFYPPQVYLGTSSKLTATVRNYSDEQRTVDVTLAEGESVGESRSLTLAPRETASIDLTRVFEAPADTACKATIKDDVLAADNVVYSPMRVRERRQVLLIAPPREAEQEDTRASAAGIDLLTYAINPGEALGLGAGTCITLKRVTPNVLEKMSLPLFSTVVIYGLSELPERSVKDLAAYVKNGGGLYVILDKEVSPARFNESFAPLLPGCQLGGWKEPPDPVFIDRNEAGVTVPLLLPLLREEWGDVDDITLSAYFALQNTTAARALRATNGDILTALLALGQGRICLQAFSCDVKDTSMPRSAVFVPMVQEILSYLGPEGTAEDSDVIRVNEVAYMSLPELRGMSGMVELHGPEKYQFPLLDSERGSIKVEGIQRGGNYSVVHPAKKGMRPRWLAVNPVLGESDLATLSEREQQECFGSVNVARLPYEQLASHFARRREVFALAAVMVFLAFAIEALFGAWQSLRRRVAPGREEQT